MNRHEGVSCDSCLKGNFRGRRYKCLICYDYDLCGTCYDSGAANTRHNADHPMQCILTRADYELYYGGEAVANPDQPQSLTCPYCGKMGYTETSLQEHVTNDHSDISFEVICPICAATPGGDPNLMTEDFAGHLALEHRSGPRDLISFLDEPVATRVHNVRRIPSGHLSTGGRSSQSGRSRRSNMHFSVFSTGGLSALSPSSRDSIDPIAELLSQLSGVRRSASSTGNTTSTQLQQLQMQLQLERQQVNASRQQFERIPRRQTQSQTSVKESTSTSESGSSHTIVLRPSTSLQSATSTSAAIPSLPSRFLLTDLLDELSINNIPDEVRQDRSQFVGELVWSAMQSRADQPETLPLPRERLKLYIKTAQNKVNSDFNKNKKSDYNGSSESVEEHLEEAKKNYDSSSSNQDDEEASRR